MKHLISFKTESNIIILKAGRMSNYFKVQTGKSQNNYTTYEHCIPKSIKYSYCEVLCYEVVL